jgi:hypothetical protein
MTKTQEFWQKMQKQAPYAGLGVLPSLLLLVWQPTLIFVITGAVAGVVVGAIELLLWRWAHLLCFGLLFTGSLCFGPVNKAAGNVADSLWPGLLYLVMYLGSFYGFRGVLHFLLRHCSEAHIRSTQDLSVAESNS